MVPRGLRRHRNHRPGDGRAVGRIAGGERELRRMRPEPNVRIDPPRMENARTANGFDTQAAVGRISWAVSVSKRWGERQAARRNNSPRAALISRQFFRRTTGPTPHRPRERHVTGNGSCETRSDLQERYRTVLCSNAIHARIEQRGRPQSHRIREAETQCLPPPSATKPACIQCIAT